MMTNDIQFNVENRKGIAIKTSLKKDTWSSKLYLDFFLDDHVRSTVQNKCTAIA